MDELMAAIQEKTGLPAEQATAAGQAAMDFLKKNPAGVGDQIESFISGNADSIADQADGLTDKIKGMFTS